MHSPREQFEEPGDRASEWRTTRSITEPLERDAAVGLGIVSKRTNTRTLFFGQQYIISYLLLYFIRYPTWEWKRLHATTADVGCSGCGSGPIIGCMWEVGVVVVTPPVGSWTAYLKPGVGNLTVDILELSATKWACRLLWRRDGDAEVAMEATRQSQGSPALKNTLLYGQIWLWIDHN